MNFDLLHIKDHLIDAFILHDLEGAIIEVNKRLLELLRCEREEIIGTTLMSLGRTPLVEELLAAVVRDSSAQFRGRLRRFDGSFIPVSVSSSLCSREGRGAIIAFIRDITEVIAREEEIQRREEQYRTLVESIHEAIFETDGEGRFTYVSSASEELLGYPPEEMVGHRFTEFLHPDDLERIIAAFSRLAEGTIGPSDYRIVTADGAERWVHSSSRPLVEDGVFRGIRGFMVDIDEAKRSEQRLARSEQRFRQLAELLPETIFEASLDGTIVYANRAAFETFGYDEADLATNVSLVALVSPSDAHRALDDYIAVIRGEDLGAIEYLGRRKDGTTFPILVHSAPIFEGAHPVGLRGVIFDQTSQLAAMEEQRRLEDKLRHSQKMEAVGYLAGGVAHDFNNLLAPILGYSELLLQDLREGDPLKEDVAEIITAGERAKQLTTKLLAFSRKQIIAMEPLDLLELVKGFEGVLRRTIREEIALTISSSGSSWPIMGDGTQLEQVLINLAVNAQDAIPHHGEVGIHVGTVDIDATGSLELPTLEPGPHVVLELTDTGGGMDEAELSHIFEPFYTTKPVDKGTGLGLATVYGIVRQHSGAIQVDSTPGEGTRFRIYLPRRLGSTYSAPQLDRIVEAPPTHQGTILVVEDDDMVRDLTTRILVRHGYSVLTAANPSEALEVGTRRADEVDLLITDVIMPEMNGKELYDALSAERRALRVVYMSGYPHDVLATKGVLDPGIQLLRKPFTMKVLLTEVWKALESSPRR